MTIHYTERVGDNELSISFDKSEDFFCYLEMVKEEKVAQKGCTEKVEQESSGWQYWKASRDFKGIPEALHPADIVEVSFRDGFKEIGCASGWMWLHDGKGGDIVAYRVVEKYKEGVVV